MEVSTLCIIGLLSWYHIIDHGHEPWQRNPPELTKLTLAFYLGQLFPEDGYDVDDGGQDDDDDDDDNDDDQEQAPDNVAYDDVSTL